MAILKFNVNPMDQKRKKQYLDSLNQKIGALKARANEPALRTTLEYRGPTEGDRAREWIELEKAKFEKARSILENQTYWGTRASQLQRQDMANQQKALDRRQKKLQERADALKGYIGITDGGHAISKEEMWQAEKARRQAEAKKAQGVVGGEGGESPNVLTGKPQDSAPKGAPLSAYDRLKISGAAKREAERARAEEYKARTQWEKTHAAEIAKAEGALLDQELEAQAIRAQNAAKRATYDAIKGPKPRGMTIYMGADGTTEMGIGKDQDIVMQDAKRKSREFEMRRRKEEVIADVAEGKFFDEDK